MVPANFVFLFHHRDDFLLVIPALALEGNSDDQIYNAFTVEDIQQPSAKESTSISRCFLGGRVTEIRNERCVGIADKGQCLGLGFRDHLGEFRDEYLAPFLQTILDSTGPIAE